MLNPTNQRVVWLEYQKLLLYALKKMSVIFHSTLLLRNYKFASELSFKKRCFLNEILPQNENIENMLPKSFVFYVQAKVTW